MSLLRTIELTKMLLYFRRCTFGNTFFSKNLIFFVDAFTEALKHSKIFPNEKSTEKTNFLKNLDASGSASMKAVGKNRILCGV